MQVDDHGPRNRLRRRAAAIAIAAALGATAPPSMATIVDSGPVSIGIPNTLAGVYVNWVTGTNGVTAAAVPGWDMNPYAIGSGTLLNMFAPNGGSNGVVGVIATTAVTTLPNATTVGSASVYVQGVASGVNFRDTATHYVGIKFMNEGTGLVNYGYAQLQTTAPGGFPATIVRYVYENTGAPITTLGGPPLLQSAVSRHVHGAAGPFDLPLSLVPTAPTTEPRQGPAHSVVFTFNTSIVSATAAITEGAAVAGTPTFSGNAVTVNLTGVIDQQYVTVTLSNVTDNVGGSGGTAAARIGVLFGDVNGSRVVTLADTGLVGAQLAQPVAMTNFLMDVNASGTLTLSDKGLTNLNLTHALPAP